MTVANREHDPGIQVFSEIRLDTRTVLEYLLSPVRKIAHKRCAGAAKYELIIQDLTTNLPCLLRIESRR